MKRPGCNYNYISLSCRQNYKNYSRHPNRGGYSSSGAHNTMDIQDEFFKMEQAMTDDCSAVINATTANTTPIEKVSLYANRLYTKEANNEALNAAVHNLRVYIKNLKADVATLKKSGHSGDAGATNKGWSRVEPKWKMYGQSQHPTWWISTYCWRHDVGGHRGKQRKTKKKGHKAEATATTRLGGSTCVLPQGL